MDASKVLGIVLREMTAIGIAYRMSGLGFEGRALRRQIDSICAWAKDALRSEVEIDCTEGTDFLKGTFEDCGLEYRG